MAFYYPANYYQNQAPDYGEDVGFSYSSSYDFAPSNQSASTPYTGSSDNEFLERQFFGYDLHHRPDDIENGHYYPPSPVDFSSNQQLITSYPTHSFDEDSRFFGTRGDNQQPLPCYHQDAVVSRCAYSPVQPTIAYSASPFYESKSFEIDPYHGDPYATRFVISYSTAEYNEPVFEEYDPTPYGGGYNPVSTYGKPLPPSDEICYPIGSDKSDAKAEPPRVNAIPEEVINTPGPGKTTDQEEEQPATSEQKDPTPKPIIPAVEVAYDDRAQEGSLDGSNKMFPPAPPGLGLDALDVCESLFGYWPCLARDARRVNSSPQEYNNYGEGRWKNEWEGAADYLFGSPDPYRGTSAGGRHHDLGIGEFPSSCSSYPYVQEVHYDQDVRCHRSGATVFRGLTR